MINWKNHEIYFSFPSIEITDKKNGKFMSIIINDIPQMVKKQNFLSLCSISKRKDFSLASKVIIKGTVQSSIDSISTVFEYINGESIKVKAEEIQNINNIATVLGLDNVVQFTTPYLILSQQINLFKSYFFNPRIIPTKNYIDSAAVLFPIFVVEGIFDEFDFQLLKKIIQSAKLFPVCDETMLTPFKRFISDETKEFLSFITKNKFTISEDLYNEIDRITNSCNEKDKKQIMGTLKQSRSSTVSEDKLIEDVNKCYEFFTTNLSRMKIQLDEEDSDTSDNQNESFENNDEEDYFPTNFLPNKLTLPTSFIH